MKLTKLLLLKTITETFDRYIPDSLEAWATKFDVDLSDLDDEDWQSIKDLMETGDPGRIEQADMLLQSLTDAPDGFLAGYAAASGEIEPLAVYNLGSQGDFAAHGDEAHTLKANSPAHKYLNSIVTDDKPERAQQKYRVVAWEGNLTYDNSPTGASISSRLNFVYTSMDSRASTVNGIELILELRPDMRLPQLYLKLGDYKQEISDNPPLPEFKQWANNQYWELTGNKEEDVDLLVDKIKMLSFVDKIVKHSQQKRFLKNPDKYLKSDLRRGIFSAVGFE